MRPSKFGGIPFSFQKRRRLLDKLFYVSGIAITFSALALSVIVVSSYDEADAIVKVVEDKQDSRYSLGTVLLLAPVSRVKKGARMDDVEFKSVPWPRNEVPMGAVRSRDELEGMYTKNDLHPGEPVRRGALITYPLAGGLADLIPPGHRATTIAVSATSGVEGWATPGAHVDVLLTYRDPSDRRRKTQIAIEDAVVLSYNGQIRKNDPRVGAVQKVLDSATVTLAVPVVDAVKLHTARAMGDISLILRHTADMRSVGRSTVDERDFSTRSAKKKAQRDNKVAGRVRFTDGVGNERELELRGDRRWYDVQEADI